MRKNRVDRIFKVESLEPRRLLSGYTPHVVVAFPRSTFTSVHTMVRDTAGNIFVLGLANPGPQEAAAIYEVPNGTANLNLITVFSSSLTIRGLIVDANDNLFTTNENGGPSQKGSIVEIPASNHTPTDIAFFDGTTTGSLPGPDLAFDSSGNLFGTTFSGAANNIGAVWELPAGSSTITGLAPFTAAVSQAGGGNFTDAQGLTFDSNGNIFGIIPGQQLNAPFGGIWELPKNTSTVNVIATFSGTDGNTPRGPLVIDSNDNIFGETSYGGANAGGTTTGAGTLFEVKAGSGAVTTLALFNGTDGIAPMGGLVTDANGNLFGTANLGGSFKNGNAQGDGTVFELPAGSSTITTLVNLNGATIGSGTSTGLFPDGNGNFFLATLSGGTGAVNGTGAPLGGALVELTPGGGSPASLSAALTGKFPPSIIAGQKANISQLLTIHNTSGSTANGPVQAALYLSTDTTVDPDSILIAPAHKTIHLKAGAHTTLNLHAMKVGASVAGGVYHLVAALTDPNGVVTDAVSLNTITIVPPKIDLSGSFAKFTSVAKAGKRFSETIIVSNTEGNIPAIGSLPIVVDTSPDGNLSDATQLTTINRRIHIGPGKSTRITLSLLAPATVESMFLVIQLDPANTFSDVNLANNTFASPLELEVIASK